MYLRFLNYDPDTTRAVMAGEVKDLITNFRQLAQELGVVDNKLTDVPIELQEKLLELNTKINAFKAELTQIMEARLTKEKGI
jgi:CII-binding regulator of phage lambda lysogenization HflD